MDESTHLPADPPSPPDESSHEERPAPAPDPAATTPEPAIADVKALPPAEPSTSNPEAAIADAEVAPPAGPSAPEPGAATPDAEAAPATEPSVSDSDVAVADAQAAPPPETAASAETGERERAHAEQDRLARENAQRIEDAIAALRTGHLDGTHRQFRAFFEQERRLHALFKELQPLHPHDRHRLWRSLKQVGAEVRRAQQEEWESRRYQSLEARETVDEKLRAAEALTQPAAGAADYRRAESLLNEVRNLLTSATPGAPGQLLVGPDRRACWDRWRAARDALRQQHGGQQAQAHHALVARVVEVARQAAEDDPLQATQHIKELQAELGRADLRRGQFEELRKRLSVAWQQAQTRLAEQRHERARQRAEWRSRVEGHLARWRDTLEQKRGQHEHLIEQAAKLVEMEKNARSQDFAEQVRQWQAQTAEKQRRTEEAIAELDERIRSAGRRLGGRGGAARRPGPARAPRPQPEAPATPGTMDDAGTPATPTDDAPGPLAATDDPPATEP